MKKCGTGTQECGTQRKNRGTRARGNPKVHRNVCPSLLHSPLLIFQSPLTTLQSVVIGNHHFPITTPSYLLSSQSSLPTLHFNSSLPRAIPHFPLSSHSTHSPLLTLSSSLPTPHSLLPTPPPPSGGPQARVSQFRF